MVVILVKDAGLFKGSFCVCYEKISVLFFTWDPIKGFIISTNCETQYHVDVDRISPWHVSDKFQWKTCKNQTTNQQNKTIVVDFRHLHDDNSHQQTTNFHDRLN